MINFLMISLVMNKLFKKSPSTYNVLGDFMYKNIKAKDLELFNNAHIIDIRDKQKYNNGHIMNANNIFFNDLLINYKKYLSKNDRYYIYCQKGNQSKLICKILDNLGYSVVNISDGYQGWKSDYKY